MCRSLGNSLRAAGKLRWRIIVNRYNEIVDEVETDPSLKIEFRQ